MFVSKLGELMEARGLNQSQLVRDTGLSHSTVRKFMKGQFDRLDGETAKVLVKYFELTSISQLVELEAALETLRVHQSPKKSPRRSTRMKAGSGGVPIAAVAL